jgi:hypothetical protein
MKARSRPGVPALLTAVADRPDAERWLRGILEAAPDFAQAFHDACEWARSLQLNGFRSTHFAMENDRGATLAVIRGADGWHPFVVSGKRGRPKTAGRPRREAAAAMKHAKALLAPVLREARRAARAYNNPNLAHHRTAIWRRVEAEHSNSRQQVGDAAWCALCRLNLGRIRLGEAAAAVVTAWDLNGQFAASTLQRLGRTRVASRPGRQRSR